MRDEQYRTYLLGRIKPLCLEAIASMRAALDEAERRVSDPDVEPEVMIQRVNHHVVWTWANASGSLENAISHLHDVRRLSEQQKEAAL